MGTEFDCVKGLDFGLVKTDTLATGQSTSLTMERVVTGSPAYMAPELATGSGVEPRTDLYGLGALAYWLPTDRHVFEGRTPLDMVVHHVSSTPEPPSKRVDQPIPADLEAPATACLTKEPSERPASAEVFEQALAACEASPAWSRDEARRWWQENGLLA